MSETCEVQGPAGRIVIERKDLPRYLGEGYALVAETVAPPPVEVLGDAWLEGAENGEDARD